MGIRRRWRRRKRCRCRRCIFMFFFLFILVDTTRFEANVLDTDLYNKKRCTHTNAVTSTQTQNEFQRRVGERYTVTETLLKTHHTLQQQRQHIEQKRLCLKTRGIGRRCEEKQHQKKMVRIWRNRGDHTQTHQNKNGVDTSPNEEQSRNVRKWYIFLRNCVVWASAQMPYLVCEVNYAKMLWFVIRFIFF